MIQTTVAEQGRAKMGPDEDRTVLEIEDLKTHFFTPSGVVRAVDGVSYAVRSREILGVVGESGCGKSVTALSILRLVADPPGRIVGGAVRFAGTNLLDLTEGELTEAGHQPNGRKPGVGRAGYHLQQIGDRLHGDTEAPRLRLDGGAHRRGPPWVHDRRKQDLLVYRL